MDIQRFVEHYDRLAQAKLPAPPSASPRFEALLEQVDAESAVVMSLLNAAVGCMAPEDVYCEVGCSQGMMLTAALLNHPECTAYAVEDADRLNDQPDWLDQLTQNLTTFALEDRVLFCCQSFEAFFYDWRSTALADRIGVYFYNSSPDYRSLILGLMLAAPFLADEALILIGQAQSRFVRQAVSDFLAAYPQAKQLIDFAVGSTHSEPLIANLLILNWNAVDRSINTPLDWHQHRDQVVIDAIDRLPVSQPILDLESLRQEAVQLHVEGKLAEAEQKYLMILRFDHRNSDIWRNLGMLYYLTENDAAAIEALHQSLAITPNHALTYYMLGLTLERAERLAEARVAYQQAVDHDQNYADALSQLGKLCVQEKELERAEALFRQATVANTSYVDGFTNLGDVLIAQERAEEAIVEYRRAIAISPQDPVLWQKLELAYQAIGDLSNACRSSVYALYYQDEHEAAIKQFETRFKLEELDRFNTLLILSDCYKNCGRNAAVSQCFEIAARLRPNDRVLQVASKFVLPAVYQSFEEITFYRQQYQQALENLAAQVEDAKAKNQPLQIGSIKNFTNLCLNYQGLDDCEMQRLYGDIFHSAMVDEHSHWTQPLEMPQIGTTGKIKIGYLAESIGNNSATRWATGWLKNHDRSRFEIYCYNIGSISDQRTQQFKLLSDFFPDLTDDLDAVCHQIRGDQLHILVYLAVGTGVKTAALAALRLAPVQCSTWGHPVTSGFPTIDYFLSGDLMEPEAAQAHYTEQLVRLPNIGICYAKPWTPAPVKTRADFGLQKDAVIYLSCQLIFKYLPQHDYLFPEIVRRIPHAQLVFVLRSNGQNQVNPTLEKQFRQRLQQTFAAVGLSSEDYCIFLPGQDWYGYTSLLSVADVFLDTLSFSGGHTTFDAIACNLPVVTCPGALMRGRQSYGALKLLGVTDTIAQTEAEYIEIAARLGLEPEWRRSIAQCMSERHHHLFDDRECVAGLEQFYQQVVAAKLAL